MSRIVIGHRFGEKRETKGNRRMRGIYLLSFVRLKGGKFLSPLALVLESFST
jgi:hypothetical protein